MTELDLLRQYEPVVRYTAGEMFFPCAVDGYLARCRLWMADAERNVTLLARPGELTVTELARYDSVPLDHRLYRFARDTARSSLDKPCARPLRTALASDTERSCI